MIDTSLYKKKEKRKKNNWKECFNSIYKCNHIPTNNISLTSGMHCKKI